MDERERERECVGRERERRKREKTEREREREREVEGSIKFNIYYYGAYSWRSKLSLHPLVVPNYLT